jgi:hypothetical protein
MEIFKLADINSVIVYYTVNELDKVPKQVQELLAPIEPQIAKIAVLDKGVLLTKLNPVMQQVGVIITNYLYSIGCLEPNAFDIIETTKPLAVTLYFQTNTLEVQETFETTLPAQFGLSRCLILPRQSNDLQLFLPTETRFFEDTTNLYLPHLMNLDNLYNQIEIKEKDLAGKFRMKQRFEFTDLDTNNFFHIIYICYLLVNGNKHVLPKKILKVIDDPSNEFDHYIEYVKDNSINIVELMRIVKDKFDNN